MNKINNEISEVNGKSPKTDIYSKKRIKEIFSQQGNILNKLVGLIYLLDYTSIYNAIISKTDPSPIKSIDFIKKRL